MKKAPFLALVVLAAFHAVNHQNPALSRNTHAVRPPAHAGGPGQALDQSRPVAAEPTPASRGVESLARFDPEAGYLTFPNKEAFNATLGALEEEIENFKFDKGQTSRLLELIREPKGGGEVLGALLRSSPLSEEVLIAFVNKGFPAEVVRQVLDENIQFSEKFEAAYLSARLPREVRQQIDQKRLKNIAYNNPVLQSFESRYAGHQSLRRERMNAETAFLATGADPASPSNPANEPTAVDDVLAAVLNKYGEVKVGRDVYIALPGKDIRVADANPRTLSHIRRHGDIPRNPVPAREPENGLPKDSSPPPVDAGIEVEPNAKYNLDCGGLEYGGTNDGTGRVRFNVRNPGERDLRYYWDFGDGLVSYKQSPVHRYTGGPAQHKVTVTVYTAQGAKCSPAGGAGTSVTPGVCSSALAVTGTNGLTASFTATPVGGVSPYTYTWYFGDSTPPTAGPATTSHTYLQSSTYAVMVTITDATNCSSNAFAHAKVANSTPPGCDRRDKDKGHWKDADNKHKFNHRFKLKNFLGLNSKLKATVGPHRKSGGVWWPSSTSCTVSMYGYVYTPVDDNPCATQHAVNLYKSNKTSYLVDTYTFGTPSVSVLSGSMSSTATAYGGSHTLTLD